MAQFKVIWTSPRFQQNFCHQDCVISGGHRTVHTDLEDDSPNLFCTSSQGKPANLGTSFWGSEPLYFWSKCSPHCKRCAIGGELVPWMFSLKHHWHTYLIKQHNVCNCSLLDAPHQLCFWYNTSMNVASAFYKFRDQEYNLAVPMQLSQVRYELGWVGLRARIDNLLNRKHGPRIPCDTFATTEPIVHYFSDFAPILQILLSVCCSMCWAFGERTHRAK